jgi:phage-related protein
MREVEFYCTRSGRSPVHEFLAQLPFKAASKIRWVLQDVLTSDHVSTKFFKKLRGTEHLWEVRVEYGGDAYRLLSFLDGARVVVVLSAFSKKTERIPPLEIELAHQRRREYLNRKNQHG